MTIRDDPTRHTFQGIGPACAWCGTASDGHRQPLTAEELQAAAESGQYIVCYSRCMWCGRQTPHEWCHACTAKFNVGKRMRSDRWRHLAEPETCELSDDECPQTRITR